MPRPIVPLAQLQHRPPECGRLRMGHQVATSRGGKRPESLDRFRMTSPNAEIIHLAAQLFGGTAEPWNDPKANPQKQYQVVITAETLPVYLVPDSLSTWYELWSAGGNQRRCDGVVVETMTRGPDGVEPITRPCICVAENQRKCDPHTRLQVLIPQLYMHGVWRLETKGWNAAVELPGMFNMISSMQADTFLQADLGIQRRTQTVAGQTNHFVVPTITLRHTLHELQQGMASAALPAGGVATPALGTGAAGALPAAPADDGIVDAELVDDSPDLVAVVAKLGRDAEQFGLDPARFVRAIRKATNDDVDRLTRAHDRMLAGTLEPLSFDPEGKILWREVPV